MTIYFLANDFRGRVNYVVVEVLTIIHYNRMLAVPPLIHLTTKQENINLLSRTTREDISRCDDEVVKLFTTSKVAAKREGFGSTHCTSFVAACAVRQTMTTLVKLVLGRGGVNN